MEGGTAWGALWRGAARERFDARGLRWVHRIWGAIVAGVGVVSLLSLAGEAS